MTKLLCSTLHSLHKENTRLAVQQLHRQQGTVTWCVFTAHHWRQSVTILHTRQ